MNYYEQIEAYRTLLKGLTDEEVARMNSAVSIEIDSRITAKINSGNIELPSLELINLFRSGNKIKAIIEFRKNRANVNILEAKRIFEKLT